MSKIPIAAPRTEGRTLGTDWSIANVVKLLRSNAEQGSWQGTDARGAGAAVDAYYIRKVSAKHLPTAVSLIFMRLAKEKCWYASLCFAGEEDYLAWDPEAAEAWLTALFGEERPLIRTEDGDHPSVRCFFGPLRN